MENGMALNGGRTQGHPTEAGRDRFPKMGNLVEKLGFSRTVHPKIDRTGSALSDFFDRSGLIVPRLAIAAVRRRNPATAQEAEAGEKRGNDLMGAWVD